MSKFYVGVKIVFAWEAKDNNGKDGYAIKYPDGYVSWSPKDVFEASYFPMGDSNDNTVTQEMVDKFFGEFTAEQISPKTVLIKATAITGFESHEVSSCVDPANFDMKIGEDIAIKRVKDVLWKCLGFVVQWGKYGLKG
jgi:hypothetical protein